MKLSVMGFYENLMETFVCCWTLSLAVRASALSSKFPEIPTHV